MKTDGADEPSGDEHKGAEDYFHSMQEKGLGTFAVFMTAISTILGAILFLRFGFAVAHVGLLWTMAIIVLGHLVTIPTALGRGRDRDQPESRRGRGVLHDQPLLWLVDRRRHWHCPFPEPGDQCGLLHHRLYGVHAGPAGDGSK